MPAPTIPRNDHPVAQGGKDPLRIEWWRFLRDFLRGVGFDAGAPIYDELYVGGNQLSLDGSLATFATFIGSTVLPSFPNAVTGDSYFVARLPNAYRDGTALSPFVEWAPAAAGSGNVDWSLEYVAADSGDTPTSSATLTKTSAAGGQNTIARALFADISGTGLVRGSLLVCRLSRLGGDASDTFNSGAAFVLGVGFKYQRNGVGDEVAHP